MKNLMKKIGKVSAAMFAAVAALGLAATSHAAAIETGFSATDTQSVLTDALNAVTPTLKVGIVAVVGVSLGIWVIFFLIGKLKKHTR